MSAQAAAAPAVPETLTCDGVTLTRFGLGVGLRHAWSARWAGDDFFVMVLPADGLRGDPDAGYTAALVDASEREAGTDVLRIATPGPTPAAAAAALERQIKRTRRAFAQRRTRKGATG